MKVRKFRFMGKCLDELFRCVQVKCIMKDEYNRAVLILDPRYVAEGSPSTVFYGDSVEQKDGVWSVVHFADGEKISSEYL